MPHTYRFFGTYRFVLALLVAVQHMLHTVFPQSWQDALIGYEVGGVAVLLFFVLSGFIICEAADATYPDRPVAFAINRCLRIVPTYWLALLVTWTVSVWALSFGADPAVRAHLGHALEDVKFAGAMANALAVFPGGKTLLAAAATSPLLDIVWALRIEMMFYAIVAAAIGIATMTSWRFTWPLGISAAGLLIADLAGIATLQHGSVQYAAYFILGGALYFAARPGDRRDRQIAVGLALAAAALTVEHILAQDMVPTSTGHERHEQAQLIMFAAGIALIFWLLRLSGTSRLAVSIDRILGDLTYPLYLMHTAALVVLSALLPDRSLAAVVIGLTLSIAVAAVTARTFEFWIGRVRLRVRVARSAQAAPLV
jgi:peptidoglycan/LPS O-acetylase OafA/YrhL